MDPLPPGDEKRSFRRGLWSPDEDERLLQCIAQGGITRWSDMPIRAGLRRSGKSCRLRWINYLRPELNHNRFSPEEDKLIIEMHRALGNRWSKMATRLRGRTDNQIKNHWNSTIKKKFKALGFDPKTHKPVQQNAVELETAAQVYSSGSQIDSRASSLTLLGSNNPQYEIMPQGASSISTMQENNFISNLPADGFFGDCIHPCIYQSQAGQLDYSKLAAQQWVPMMDDMLAANATPTPNNFRGSECFGLFLEETSFWEGLSHISSEESVGNISSVYMF